MIYCVWNRDVHSHALDAPKSFLEYNPLTRLFPTRAHLGDFEAEVPERRIRVPSKLFSSVPRPFSQTLSVGTAVEAR